MATKHVSPDANSFKPQFLAARNWTLCIRKTIILLNLLLKNLQLTTNGDVILGKAGPEPGPARKRFVFLRFIGRDIFSVEANGEKENYRMWHFLNIQESSNRDMKNAAWSQSEVALHHPWAFQTLCCLGPCSIT